MEWERLVETLADALAAALGDSWGRPPQKTPASPERQRNEGRQPDEERQRGGGRLVSAATVEGAPTGSVLTVGRNAIVTPLARDVARQKNITLAREGDGA
ncbi:MAG: hypothetical protein RSC08_05405 [Oscillospiraceae bacterium]